MANKMATNEGGSGAACANAALGKTSAKGGQ